MKNIETIIKEAGLELTDDQKAAITKAVGENYKPIADYDNQVAKYKTLEGQYKDVKSSLDKFDGVSIDDLKKQIQEEKDRADAAEKKAKDDMAERDYSDAVKAQLESVAFSSEAAKKQFMTDLIEKKLPLEGGKLLGFDDYVSAYKEKDKGAFIDAEAAKSAAKFTAPIGVGAGGGAKQTDEEAMTARMAAAMGIKPNEKEN